VYIADDDEVETRSQIGLKRTILVYSLY